LMEPSHDPDDRQASIPKFRQRFGQHLHSIAWYSDDVPALAQRLRDHGIRVIDGGYGTIFTHPKDTFGQLQFQTGPPEIPVPDPRFDADWARSTESIRHPMTLIRASHITTLVTDLDRARHFYREVLGLPEITKPRTFDFKVLWFQLGNQQLHLLQKPQADTRSPRHFALRVKDVQQAREHFHAFGIETVETTTIPHCDRFFVFDPDGNRIEIIQWLEAYDPAESGASQLDR